MAAQKRLAEDSPSSATTGSLAAAPGIGGVASPGNVYLLNYSFNQDYSCFACGTTSGFRVFTVSPVSEVHRREAHKDFTPRSVVLISMLFKTNIFALVSVADDDPSDAGLNKVQIWDDSKSKFVGELRSRNEVKGVVLRRDVIAMVCEYAIYVYTCDRLRVICHLTTNANTRGLCVLASASDPWILCCPGQSTGAVRVQFGQDDRASHVFSAHQTALAALALNESGTLVATASETGTVAKVFQAADGQLLYRLRRSARPATISCLSFGHEDRYLGLASASTVHIFKLDASTASQEGDMEAVASPSLGPAEDPHDLPPEAPLDLRANPTIEQIANQIQKAVTKVASQPTAKMVQEVMKGVVPKYFQDLRSFAAFRIPDMDTGGQPTVDARSNQARILGPQLAFHKSEPRIYVLHYSGILYECLFKPDHDPTLGTQECSFLCATTWFAVRPDFKVQGTCNDVATVAGGAIEDDDEAEEWQLL